jgi:hypothetical protein
LYTVGTKRKVVVEEPKVDDEVRDGKAS